MNPEVIQITYGVALTALTGAVSWLVVTVISNKSRVDVMEEQIKGAKELRGELGQVHRRVDELVSTTAELCGQMKQTNRTTALILEHLMGDKR